MRYCSTCERAMLRKTNTGRVIFCCTTCGELINGDKNDTKLCGCILHSYETVEKYRKLLHNAAHDRVNQQVFRTCPKCNLNYMTQVRVGDREVVVYACKCGYSE